MSKKINVIQRFKHFGQDIISKNSLQSSNIEHKIGLIILLLFNK